LKAECFRLFDLCDTMCDATLNIKHVQNRTE